MDKTDKYIDELFHQKFSGAGATNPPSVSEWMQMSKVIRRKNFLRFSPGSFNVYYLSAVVATITTVGSFVLPDIIGNDKNEIISPPACIEIRDSLSAKDSIPNSCDSSFIMKCQTKKENCIRNSFDRGLVNGDASAIDSQSVGKTDEGEKPVPVNAPDNANEETIERNCIDNIENSIEKQQQYIVAPADTIIKTDTIHIQKKGVQFKRKKNTF